MTALSEARRDAQELIRLLEPACERIAVAGSVRREAAQVRDIDLVLVPRMEPRPGRLFDGDLVSAVDGLIARTIVQPSAHLERPRDAKNGSRQKQLRFRGRKVDLWIVLPPASWGVIFALRTGTAEFGRLLVTPECYGGALPGALRIADGRLTRGGCIPVSTPEESDFFAALELPTLPPRERTAASLTRLLAQRRKTQST